MVKPIASAIKPAINKNLKIRQATDSEKVLSEERAKYTTKAGKTTMKGAAKLMGAVGKKIIGRAIGTDE